MRKLNFGFILIMLIALSCSSEKINLSPVISMSSTNEIFSYGERKNIIAYSSEITNLITTFPKFKNDAVNTEVGKLKYFLKDYIGAVDAYNINGRNIARRNFEKSYKKLQTLRKYLKPDEDEVLNRYLVRIKTNMTFLESNISKDSAATPKK